MSTISLRYDTAVNLSVLDIIVWIFYTRDLKYRL